MGKRILAEKSITKNQIVSLIVQTPNLCTVSYSIEIDEINKPLMTDDIIEGKDELGCTLFFNNGEIYYDDLQIFSQYSDFTLIISSLCCNNFYRG
jgi:hypothetical protein